MLEKRDYSRGEMIDRLIKKGEMRPDAEAVADRLAELCLINDENYAALVVRHYAAKGFGAARIKEELYRRFVPRELWDEALAGMPDTEDSLDALLRSKLKSPDPDRAELRKATDALRRRGFTWDEIREAVERLNTERNSSLS